MISLQGLSRATKSLGMAAVVALYSINDITLNRKRLSKFLGPKQMRKIRLQIMHSK
jgi:hypothetical protein